MADSPSPDAGQSMAIVAVRGSVRVVAVALGVLRRAFAGELTVTAGGIALFCLLAAIPSLAAIVSIYGLAADPGSIHGHLDGLVRVFPRAVVGFLIDELRHTASSSSRELSFAIATSLAVALFSARTAVDAITEGLNRAYGVTESRTRLHRMITSVMVAAAALLIVLILTAVVVALPATTRLVGSASTAEDVSIIRWPVLLISITAALAVMYRTVPAGGWAARRRAVPGAVVATLLWLAVSYGLSIWVEQVANYEVLYGTFASVIVVILWFYLSALSILVGAVVNAELARHPRAPKRR